MLVAVLLPSTRRALAPSRRFEDVAVTGGEAGGDEVVRVAPQGDWGVDPDGLEDTGADDLAPPT